MPGTIIEPASCFRKSVVVTPALHPGGMGRRMGTPGTSLKAARPRLRGDIVTRNGQGKSPGFRERDMAGRSGTPRQPARNGRIKRQVEAPIGRAMRVAVQRDVR